MMNLKLFNSALFTWRNVLIFIVSIIATIIFGRTLTPLIRLGIPVYLLPIFVYIGCALQTMFTEEFQNEFIQREKINKIRSLNTKILRISSEIRRYIPFNQQQDLRKVLTDKDDIINSFMEEEQTYVKEMIVEKSLNLVLSYMKLLKNYSMRIKILSKTNTSEITNRINDNARKVNFTKDLEVQGNIEKSIKMEQTILERTRLEKIELERISSKLKYIESTVTAFKHQILSSEEPEEIINKLDEAINEAIALENAIFETRKGKLRN